MSAVVWGIPDKTDKVDDDHQIDDGDQNDATSAEMVRIHLDKPFCLNLEILASEKQELESRLINISGLT